MTQHAGESNGPGRATQTSEAAAQAPANGYSIAVRRNGPAVEITLTAGNDYASMELYDSLIRSIKAGHLRFEIDVARP